MNHYRHITFSDHNKKLLRSILGTIDVLPNQLIIKFHTYDILDNSLKIFKTENPIFIHNQETFNVSWISTRILYLQFQLKPLHRTFYEIECKFQRNLDDART
jgi:hypothetical protein